MQDLTLVRNQTLESTIIVDNSPMAYMFQPENAIDCIRYGTCTTHVAETAYRAWC